MASTLYRNAVVHSSADPFAEALVVADGQVAWMGSESTVHTVADGVDEVVDLDGALVTPAFVDAHAHVLQTGAALEGVDLSPAAGVTSLRAALDAVAAAARRARDLGASSPLVGHGWDETGWPEGRPPTREELDRVTGGAPVHLSRADVHSAVVSSSFARVAGCTGLPGWRDDGLVTGEAHRRALDVVTAVAREDADRLHATALRAAAAQGIASVHEHSRPDVDDLNGLATLLATTRDAASGLPLVVGYRAALCTTEDEVRDLLAAVPGLTGVGGDLCVDGSLGSRTAALRAPYADAPPGPGQEGSRGVLELSAEQVAAHVVAVARARTQAAFHVIGDRATDEVVAGLRLAADQEGVAAIGAGRHRLEHAEMIDAPALAAMVLLGLVASVQPAFDARWGGPDGMYARRLGAGRAAAMNPLADLAAAGVPLALGSDAPVTPFDPWGAVLAAIAHHDTGQRISARAAFRAHTRGGWRAAGLDHTGAGEIRLGSPATLAFWRTESLAVQAPDGRLAAWSTDPRAGTPLLPELGADLARPVCLRTLRDGVVLHDALG